MPSGFASPSACSVDTSNSRTLFAAALDRSYAHDAIVLVTAQRFIATQLGVVREEPEELIGVTNAVHERGSSGLSLGEFARREIGSHIGLRYAGNFDLAKASAVLERNPGGFDAEVPGGDDNVLVRGSTKYDRLGPNCQYYATQVERELRATAR